MKHLKVSAVKNKYYIKDTAASRQFITHAWGNNVLQNEVQRIGPCPPVWPTHQKLYRVPYYNVHYRRSDWGGGGGGLRSDAVTKIIQGDSKRTKHSILKKTRATFKSKKLEELKGDSTIWRTIHVDTTLAKPINKSLKVFNFF
jgi:hypothetical protein